VIANSNNSQKNSTNCKDFSYTQLISATIESYLTANSFHCAFRYIDMQNDRFWQKISLAGRFGANDCRPIWILILIKVIITRKIIF